MAGRSYGSLCYRAPYRPTLAGNFTLVGSVANLIVAQRARAEGVIIGFWAYVKIGAPLTLLTLLFGVWWL
jgi:Na+/H+ antiporter NhaD/arsenite permease-like protein